MVLNLSEIETKVREATNDDAWCVARTGAVAAALTVADTFSQGSKLDGDARDRARDRKSVV